MKLTCATTHERVVVTDVVHKWVYFIIHTKRRGKWSTRQFGEMVFDHYEVRRGCE